jgi:AcrR family transcriptional regulator
VSSSQLRTRIRHQHILDAALAVFSRQGYKDTSVDDIASTAQTSKGGIYFHFPGKQAIFLALLDYCANLLYSRIVERVDAELDPIAKVNVALQVFLQTFASHRVLARLFLVEAPGAGPEFYDKMREIHARFTALVKDNLDEAVRRDLILPLDTDIASIAWFGALNQIVVRWILDEREYPLEGAYLPLRSLLLRSIGAPAEEVEAGHD